MTQTKLLDPLKFAAHFWPELTFYPKQEEVIYSVLFNEETYVPAGNALGKDFVAGFIALYWFVSRRPARVVTTSVKMDQLQDVLWGEIRRFISLSRFELPIKYNHMQIRAKCDDGSLFPNAELVGQVSNTPEGLLGRHSTGGFRAIQDDVPRTLVIFDEASGVDDDTYQSTQTWAHRKLIIGNPFPCENFFKRAVKAGDLLRPCTGGPSCPICRRAQRADGSESVGRDQFTPLAPHGYLRKIIKVTAEDSPNVQLARIQEARGEAPTNEILVPGVKGYAKLMSEKLTWDPILQSVGHAAEFWEGADVLLFPPDWLEKSAVRAEELDQRKKGTRRARAIGIDPAEGGDNTTMTAVDEYGVLEQVSKKTPDTNLIYVEALAFMRKWGLIDAPECVVFDRGGGGKQCADRLTAAGYGVRSIGFGEAVTPDPRKSPKGLSEMTEERGERYAYVNRRAEMYGTLRTMVDPSSTYRIPARGNSGDEVELPCPFALPRGLVELRRQLGLIPLTYDAEGRLKLIPKNKKNKDSKERTLTELIGHSPDESDSLVLAVYGMVNPPRTVLVGAIVGHGED